jgi:GNAT superfamily N-acetyltransferase
VSDATARAAVLSDVDALLALQAAYYADDRYAFEEHVARALWQHLISDPGVGQVWVVEVQGRLAAYVVLTFGFSLEYQGRDAWLDELYVVPALRGQGLARHLLSLLESACSELGVMALHLEVERHKGDARELYRRWGFAEKDRVLMTKRLAPRAGDDARPQGRGLPG